MRTMALSRFAIFVFLACDIHTAGAADKAIGGPVIPQRLGARYRLFSMGKAGNFLELDTQTGLLWQLQFPMEKNAVSRVKVLINSRPFARAGKNGRFTVHPTNNLENFLLLDHLSGRVWQVTFDGAVHVFPFPLLKIVN